MEQSTEFNEQYSSIPVPDVSSNKLKETAKTIVMMLPYKTRKPLTFSKKHVDRYLYTFSFQIGADLPSDDVAKNIYRLLVGTQEGQVQVQGVDERNMQILVEVCLNLYHQAKKTAIGGIFDRVVMGLKQSLYYSKLSSFSEHGAH